MPSVKPSTSASGSMEQADYALNGRPVNRLEMVKAVAGNFIERRRGDRLGLILFGTRAYVQTPLTHDRKTVQAFLNDSVIGLAGRETAVGDAVALAVKRLREQPEDNRVLILLTDGANTAGNIAPREAARVAADRHWNGPGSSRHGPGAASGRTYQFVAARA